MGAHLVASVDEINVPVARQVAEKSFGATLNLNDLETISFRRVVACG
jgi:hypothetical protein